MEHVPVTHQLTTPNLAQPRRHKAMGMLEQLICQVCARGEDPFERRADIVCEERGLDAVA